MEATNGLVFFPMQTQEDLAIRRFCPARVNQQQSGGEEQPCRSSSGWEEYHTTEPNEYFDHLLWSSTAATSEEEVEPVDTEFVNSFFNMECYLDNNTDNNNNNKLLQEEINPEFFSSINAINHHHRHLYGDHHRENLDDDRLDMMIMTSTLLEDSEVDLEKMMMNRTNNSSFEDSEPEIRSPYNSEKAMTTTPTSSNHQGAAAVDEGLQLVHLLLACAEAVGCRDTRLAGSVLGRIWPWVSPWGDSLQRVSYCFAVGLKSRLSLFLHNLNASGTFTSGAVDDSSVTREEKSEAFQLLHQATPYIAFGFMAANDAIVQAAQGKEYLHIVDLGMEHTLQWPSLIRTLASRVEGPPKSLRITGIVGDHRIVSDLQPSTKDLIDESTSLGIHLEFHVIPEPATPSLLTRENLNVREGEALFVNSVMHLHKYVKESRGSLKTILQAIKKLGPTLLTVVEQDANHNGPFFLGRFLESLHYYSAVFDSLEASLPRSSPQRTKIERVHFAEEIRNIVAFEGSGRVERHERADQWRRQLGRAGFQAVGFKSVSQARMMLAVYGCDGYTLATDKGCLLLGWKGRPIMLASAWHVPNN